MKLQKNYLLSLLAVCFLFPLQAQNNDAKRFMERGKDAYFDRDYDRAISYFEEVAQIDPYFKDLYQYRGNSFFKLEEFREAELDYLEAIKQLPKPDKGSSRRRGGDLILLDPGGEEDLNKRYSLLYNNLGVTRFKLGKRTAANTAFDTALDYDPDSQVALDNERSASYNRSNQLIIEDEVDIKKARRGEDGKSAGRRTASNSQSYESEFNKRPVSPWKPDPEDSYTQMLDLREDREEAVARDEISKDERKKESVLDRLLKPKVFIKRNVRRKGKTYRKPDFLGATQNYLSIDRVVIRDKSTYVTIKVANENSNSHWISMAPRSSSEAFKIVGRSSSGHKVYKLKSIKNMAQYPNTTELKANDDLYFTLEFDRIADNIGIINIIEGKNQRESAWNFYQVDLRK